MLYLVEGTVQHVYTNARVSMSPHKNMSIEEEGRRDDKKIVH